MIIIFLGPPGAGKGTQAQLLSEKINLPVISVGHLLRQAYERGTPEGVEAWRDYSLKGLNAPIGLKFKIIGESLSRAEGGFILDNFPRTEEDLKALQKYLQEKGKPVTRVFHLTIDDKTALERMLSRQSGGELRSDDNLELLKIRIKEGYHKDLSTILDYFRRQKVLVEISGNQDVNVVQQQILRNLGLND